jgi:hypothetical protein
MDNTALPYKFDAPWASGAGGSYLTNPVPVTTGSGNAASQDLGFPPNTAVDPSAGGVPPDISDFNGMGYYATAWLQWLQAGGRIVYDAVFAAAIGGYPRGAVLRSSATDDQFWLSTAENNATDPDGGSPADWTSLFVGPIFAAVADVTGSRAIGATYTNGTKKPVFVAVEGITTVGSQNLLLFSGTTCIAQVGVVDSGTTCFVSGIIPAGGTYRVDTSSVGFSVQTWSETN